jgi:hypothetical protein
MERLLVGSLAAGPKRFGQLRDEVDGISENMLTQTLRSLERTVSWRAMCTRVCRDSQQSNWPIHS